MGTLETAEFKQFETRIRHHKRNKLLIIGGTVLVLAIICVFMVSSYINRVFNAYEVLNTVEREEAGNVQYLSYQNHLLKITRDGATAMDASGNILFNGAYTMQNPKASICGDYIVVADIGGTDLVVFDGENSGTKLSVTLPIVQAQVAKQGVVAVLLEDKDSNVFQLLRTDGVEDKEIAKQVTYAQNDGFTVNIALSEDGKKLVTNYILVNNGVLESRVTFYNFSEVGQNKNNNMVGMKSYGKTLVANVEFLNNNTVCVYTESGFELFSMKEINKEVYQESFDGQIKSVFSNESYVGFVIEDLSKDKKYQVMVYDTSGDRVLSQEINYTYNTIVMEKKEIIFYSDTECHILKLNGVEKFEYSFTVNVTAVLPINNYNKYFLVEDNGIDMIKLTEE